MLAAVLPEAEGRFLMCGMRGYTMMELGQVFRESIQFDDFGKEQLSYGFYWYGVAPMYSTYAC